MACLEGRLAQDPTVWRRASGHLCFDTATHLSICPIYRSIYLSYPSIYLSIPSIYPIYPGLSYLSFLSYPNLATSLSMYLRIIYHYIPIYQPIYVSKVVKVSVGFRVFF